jgi:hypothetical protein
MKTRQPLIAGVIILALVVLMIALTGTAHPRPSNRATRTFVDAVYQPISNSAQLLLAAWNQQYPGGPIYSNVCYTPSNGLQCGVPWILLGSACTCSGGGYTFYGYTV